MVNYVALLRGVNVGGVKISMGDLRAIAEQAGFSTVSTHLNSGNLLYSSDTHTPDEHAADLSRRIEHAIGRAIPVLVRTPEQLERVRAAALSTFPDADHARVAIAFLDRALPTGTDALGTWDAEQYVIDGDAIYLHYPHGQGESTLTTVLIERRLGVVATARGVKTVAGLIAKSIR